MSVQAMAWVFEHSLTQGLQRLCLLSIANHASETNYEAWPSITCIANEARCQPDAARTAVAALHRDGHLTRILNGAPDRRIPTGKRPNLYAITVDQDEIDRLAAERGGNGRRAKRGNHGARLTLVAGHPPVTDGGGVATTPPSLKGGFSDRVDPPVTDGAKPSLEPSVLYIAPGAFGDLSHAEERILGHVLAVWEERGQIHPDGKPMTPERKKLLRGTLAWIETVAKNRAEIRQWAEEHPPSTFTARDPLFDALVEMDDKIDVPWFKKLAPGTDSRIAAAIKLLPPELTTKERRQATADEVRKRAAAFRDVLPPNTDRTANAIAKWWDSLPADRERQPQQLIMTIGSMA